MNILIIGYGNTLRSDDGAGQVIASKIAAWKLPGVRSLAVHQLTPELILDIVQADIVIFIDAVATNSKKPISVEIKQLSSEATNTNFGHTCNPQSLIHSTQLLYDKVIRAYWVLIPALNFDFGEEFSPVTQQGIELALNQIKLLIRVKHSKDYTDMKYGISDRYL